MFSPEGGGGALQDVGESVPGEGAQCGGGRGSWGFSRILEDVLHSKYRFEVMIVWIRVLQLRRNRMIGTKVEKVIFFYIEVNIVVKQLQYVSNST